MKIGELIKILEVRTINSEPFITRGKIIDFIAENTDNWALVIKALLINNPSKSVSTVYLVDKLKQMESEPNREEIYLSSEPRLIYLILQRRYNK